ncbi:MAG: O-antigen ligase family protein, partial [Gaiellaceae bacterium]
AARSETFVARSLAWSAPVFLLPTVWFTFGRGPVAAIIVGLTAALAIDSRRLQLVTVALLLTPFATLALWLSAREPDLNRRTAALGTAAEEGHRLALWLLLLAVAAGIAGAAFHLLAPRVHVRRRIRRAYALALVAIAVAAVAVSFAQYGSPQRLVSRGYHSFTGETAHIAPNADLSQRFLSLGNRARLDQWRVAVDDFRAHPWLGSGAGTYEEAWNKDRPAPAWKVRDAHSLYLEVLGELGPIGLSLLVLTLLVPVVVAVRVRRHPLAPFALAAFVAYLFHAGVDWDWEMPAVTLAAVICGAALVVAARKDEDARILTRRTRIAGLTVTVALTAFAFVGLMGNLALASSRHAAAGADWQKSEAQARKAMRWAPWSSEPWRLLGEAQYARHDFASARVSFHKALAKDPNSWLLWADLATASSPGTWRAPARRALALNPLAPELGEMRAELKGRP